jgi:hypothetical protein
VATVLTVLTVHGTVRTVLTVATVHRCGTRGCTGARCTGAQVLSGVGRPWRF